MHLNHKQCAGMSQKKNSAFARSNKTYTTEKSKCFFPEFQGPCIYKAQEIIVHHRRNNLENETPMYERDIINTLLIID